MTTYEIKVEKIREQNEQYLELFENNLKEANLKPKTINNHLSNVEFYLDTLLWTDLMDMKAGCGYEINSFLGDYFIRKTSWSTPATIKANAASIKKFYKAILDHGHVKRESYDELCDVIKEFMPNWQARCEKYNDDDDYYF